MGSRFFLDVFSPKPKLGRVIGKSIFLQNYGWVALRHDADAVAQTIE